MSVRITFQVRTVPTAGSAELLGDFTNWQERPIRMKKVMEGLFEISVKFRQANTHVYKFRVDGEWKEELDDGSPANGTVPNPFGTRNYSIDISL
jgi:1,4-alpha-glucan branching enzyme